MSDEGRALRAQQQKNVRELRSKLVDAGLPVILSSSHIIPIHVICIDLSFLTHRFCPFLGWKCCTRCSPMQSSIGSIFHLYSIDQLSNCTAWKWTITHCSNASSYQWDDWSIGSSIETIVDRSWFKTRFTSINSERRSSTTTELMTMPRCSTAYEFFSSVDREQKNLSWKISFPLLFSSSSCSASSLHVYFEWFFLFRRCLQIFYIPAK